MKDLSLAVRQGSEQCQQQLLPALAALTAHTNKGVLGRQRSVEGWQECFGDCLYLAYSTLVIHAPKTPAEVWPPLGSVCLRMRPGSCLAEVTPLVVAVSRGEGLWHCSIIPEVQEI